MGYTHHAPRKDANHTQIVEAARSFGADVVDCAALKNAFDLLILYKGKTFVVEVKDGTKPPSKKKLTEGELECQAMCIKQGVNYHVVESVEDLAKLLLIKF